jgi:small-conductance mechanosensitive channel
MLETWTLMHGFWSSISNFVQRYTGLSPPVQVKILLAAATIAAFFVLRYLVVKLVARRVQDVGRKYVLSKGAGYLLGLIAVVVLFQLVSGGIAGIATYLGIVSAGLAVALQDPVVNFAGSIYIFVRKPFTTGDRIQIAQHAGDVIDISLFQFTLVEIGNWVDADQSTGRIIHVPNGWVFKHTTCNYTQGFNFIWNELPVTVTFESNWEKAKEILARVAQAHSAIKSEHAAEQIRRAASRFMILYQHLEPIVWTSVAANGVTLTARYLCTPRARRSTTTKMWEEILREFAKCEDIDLAYPTTRIFRNTEEGKRGTWPAEPRPAAPRVFGDQPAPQPG